MCILIYHQIVEELHQCFQNSQKVDRLDEKLDRVLFENRQLLSKKELFAVENNQIARDTVREMESSLALSLRERELLTIERDVEQVGQLHDDIQLRIDKEMRAMEEEEELYKAAQASGKRGILSSLGLKDKKPRTTFLTP